MDIRRATAVEEPLGSDLSSSRLRADPCPAESLESGLDAPYSQQLVQRCPGINHALVNGARQLGVQTVARRGVAERQAPGLSFPAIRHTNNGSGFGDFKRLHRADVA